MAELISDYLVHPGQCFLCGSSDPARGVIDCGEMPGQGSARRFRMYVCGECAVGMATQVAACQEVVVIPRDEYERLRNVEVSSDDSGLG